MSPPPSVRDITALLARHAPGARRLLTAWSGAHAVPLLHAGRQAGADWVMAIAPATGGLQALRERLPQDALLHLRERAPLPDPATALRQAAAQGLRADVLLLAGPLAGAAAAAAAELLDPGGLLLVPPGAGHDAAGFETREATPSLVVLAPRQPAAPLPPATGGRAIIVLVVGPQAEAEWEITAPGITAYATAIGAELRLVRSAPGLPRPIIKAAAQDVAAAYDRFILMDTDIVLRPHCPDLFAIVPPEAVGAFPEGRRLDRTALAAQAAEMLGGAPFSPETYFNAGVLVLSRRHLHMLDELGRGIVAGSLIEQNLVNVAARRGGHPIFELDGAFNHIPGGRAVDDWRCGWVLHMAGSPKPAFRRRPLWERLEHDRGIVWAERPRLGKHLRLPHLAAQAERITGREVHALDPEELDYAAPHAMPRLMPEGYAAAWLEPREAGGPSRRAWGAFAVPPGRWTLRVLPLPGEALPPLGFAVGAGEEAQGRLDQAAALDVEVAADAPLRVALFAGEAPAGIAGILLGRPGR